MWYIVTAEVVSDPNLAVEQVVNPACDLGKCGRIFHHARCDAVRLRAPFPDRFGCIDGSNQSAVRCGLVPSYAIHDHASKLQQHGRFAASRKRGLQVPARDRRRHGVDTAAHRCIQQALKYKGRVAYCHFGLAKHDRQVI